ncbi:MAG: glycerophosphodiester phosphodiesterase family protein [Ruminococcus sp.]
MCKKARTTICLLLVLLSVITVLPFEAQGSTVVPNTSVFKVTAFSKSMLVKWKKQKQATGYQLQYSTSSKFTSYKKITVRKNTTTSKLITNLTPDNNYYVRVRTYKKTNGKNEFSPWSAKKKVYIDELQLVGHRGFSSKYPENTTEAFNGAVSNDFKGIECDVWESENGDIMVHHDSTIRRMCGVNKFIWKINSKNRVKYPIIHGSNIADYEEKPLIPTIEEVVNFAKENNCKLYIHIKADTAKGYKISKAGIEKIIKAIQSAGIKKNTVVFCRKQYLSYFKNNRLQTGIIPNGETRNQLNSNIKWCLKNNVKTLVIYDGGFDTFKNPDNGKSFIKACHKSGIKVGLYTTKTKAQFNYLNKIGADFAMSDYKLN